MSHTVIQIQIGRLYEFVKTSDVQIQAGRLHEFVSSLVNETIKPIKNETVIQYPKTVIQKFR